MPIEMNIAIQLVFDHHSYRARAKALARRWHGFGAVLFRPTNIQVFGLACIIEIPFEQLENKR